MPRGSKEKECPYSKSDVPEILDGPLEKELIKLPKSKHPREIKATKGPKYCQHHKIISHPIEKCKAFKEQVLQLVKEGKIILDEEDTKESD